MLFARIAGAGDIRRIGSGNIGATNVLRTGSKWAAALTLIFDAGKGALPALIARHYFGDLFALAAALGAFFGHLFPVWLGFKGGKGVATFLGIMLALYWPVGVASAGTWLIGAALWRRSSLAALLAAGLSPAYFLLATRYGGAGDMTPFVLAALLLAALIVIKHRENISRLIAGTEPRIGK